MSKVTTFLILLVPISLFSQGTLSPATEDFFVGHEVHKTNHIETEGTRADIDGDGILDLFTVSKNVFSSRHHMPTHDAAISWRPGLDSENNFGERQIIFQSELPYRMTEILWAELSDIDNDGDLDLYIAFYYDFGWMENMDGKGAFSVYTKIGNVVNSGHINFDLFIPRIRDIDGDGYNDLLIYTGNIPSRVGAYWYKNLNGRGFSNAKLFTIFDYIFHSKYMDLNADGKAEILLGDKNYETGACLIQSFNYQEDKEQLIADTLLMADRCFDKIEYHDFNGDGLKDILLLKENQLMWQAQMSNDLTFDTSNFIDTTSIYSSISPQISRYFVKVIDKEADGDLDIFFYDQTGLRIYENKTGVGDFELFFHQPIDPTYSLKFFHWADLDNDGDNDLLFQEYINASDDNFYWIANLDGMGNFAEKERFFEGDIARAFRLTDLDGNGKINIVFQDRNGGQYSLEYEDATQSFSNIIITPHSNPISPDTPNRHQLEDIDGDEDLDLIFFYGNQMKWIENIERTKRFEPEKVIIDGLPSDNNHFIDVDKDGDLDVLSGNESWYRNDDGTFSDSFAITGVEEGTTVQIIDVDQDGYPDILGRIYDEILRDHYYQFYKNEQGSGQFKALGVTKMKYDRNVDLEPMDIDSDGFVDLVRHVNGYLIWYRNESGSGAYTRFDVPNISLPDINHQLTGVDMDQDGDIDIIDRSETRDGLYILNARWLENVDGKGDFQIAHPILRSSFYQKGDMAIGDLDADADMDLIFTSSIKAPLYLNFNKQESFNENIGLALVKGAMHGAAKILIGDLDLDGDLDLFTHTPTYAWYENLNKSPMVVSSVEEELEKTILLNYYPNPFHESIQFDIPELPQGDWILSIRDLYGRAIESQEVNSNSSLLFQNAELTPGIYFFDLKNGDTQVVLSTGKLVAR